MKFIYYFHSPSTWYLFTDHLFFLMLVILVVFLINLNKIIESRIIINLYAIYDNNITNINNIMKSCKK